MSMSTSIQLPLYLWMKWLHIVAVISWMAGVLYLYRVLINHRERGVNNADIHELLKLMESRLYKFITKPAMTIAILAGIAMIALSPELLQMGWLHVKLTSVAGLIISTLWAGKIMRRAAVDPLTLPTSRTLRILNEVPTLFMLIIVWMVVFKSF